MRLIIAATFGLFFWVNMALGQNIVLASVDNSVPGVNETKLFDILSSVTEYHGTTPIELKIILTEGESEKIRGIENRYVNTADLNIQAFNLLTNQHLDSKDIKLTGTGSSRNTASKDLVKSIRRKKTKITSWLTKLDSGDVDCSLLSQRVRQLVNSSYYNQAYTLANNPNCTEGSFELKEKILMEYQKRLCDLEIRKAESLIAIKKYKEAVHHIIRIDPDANCGDRLNNLVTKLSENYNSDEDRAFQFYMEYFKNEARSQQDREALMHLILLNKLLDD